MISFPEARNVVHSYVQDFGKETISLLQAVNRTITNDVVADRDFPPFDRVTMDGIALNSHAFAKGKREFAIEKTVAAGTEAQALNNENACVEIMTGAILPANTDAVIPYEQCSITNGIARVMSDSVMAWQNIHRKGRDEKAGTVLLPKDTRLSPARISLLATVGIPEVEVYKLPTVAVCATGDELVDITETPLPHQLRQSNIYFLAADMQQQGITANLYHLPDNPQQMKAQLERILEHSDVLMLSGAVSAGKFDYLPGVLASLQMQTLFHGIAQRPGKPFLFGILGRHPVFGFPGNPVSSFVCYHVYFKEWLRRCARFIEKQKTAILLTDVTVSGTLTHHTLVKLLYEDGCVYAEPVTMSTSGDQVSLLHADGILTLPSGRTLYKKGEVCEVTLCR